MRVDVSRTRGVRSADRQSFSQYLQRCHESPCPSNSIICSSAPRPAAPEAAWLVEFGLVEGSPNVHPGQGTANRRFFFDNAFLELLWVADAAKAQADGPARRMRLWERWSGAGLPRARSASVFGLRMRARAKLHFRRGSIDRRTCPIRWRFTSDRIRMWSPSRSCFTSPLPVDRTATIPTPPGGSRQHPAGPRVITSVSIVRSSAAEPSAVLRAVAIACPWLKIEAGGENLMELGFDDGRTGKTADFRQVLPLVIRR